ncbi:MAG: hypothetical protein JWR05_3136 [Mucilaginibacter sp.]|nr:hypothetical protein [Mucilaginibacter sp.]
MYLYLTNKFYRLSQLLGVSKEYIAESRSFAL